MKLIRTAVLAALSTVVPIFGATITGSGLLVETDIHDYYFTVTAPGLVTITVDDAGGSSDYDSEINLYHWDGSLDLADFIANDDDGGSGTNSLLSLNLNAGNYLLRVGTHDFPYGNLGATNPDGHHTGTNYALTISGDTVVGQSSVPEPSTFALLGSAMAGLAAWRRRRA